MPRSRQDLEAAFKLAEATRKAAKAFVDRAVLYPSQRVLLLDLLIAKVDAVEKALVDRDFLGNDLAPLIERLGEMHGALVEGA